MQENLYLVQCIEIWICSKISLRMVLSFFLHWNVLYAVFPTLLHVVSTISCTIQSQDVVLINRGFSQYASWVLGFVPKNNTKHSMPMKINDHWKKRSSLKLKHPLSFIYRMQTLLNTPLLSPQGSRVPGMLTKHSEAPTASERGWLSSSPVPLNRALCQRPREPFV